jgi:hypothetical protein
MSLLVPRFFQVQGDRTEILEYEPSMIYTKIVVIADT